jgi:hypothetical protein
MISEIDVWEYDIKMDLKAIVCDDMDWSPSSI